MTKVPRGGRILAGAPGLESTPGTRPLESCKVYTDQASILPPRRISCTRSHQEVYPTGGLLSPEKRKANKQAKAKRANLLGKQVVSYNTDYVNSPKCRVCNGLRPGERFCDTSAPRWSKYSPSPGDFFQVQGCRIYTIPWYPARGDVGLRLPGSQPPR